MTSSPARMALAFFAIGNFFGNAAWVAGRWHERVDRSPWWWSSTGPILDPGVSDHVSLVLFALSRWVFLVGVGYIGMRALEEGKT